MKKWKVFCKPHYLLILLIFIGCGSKNVRNRITEVSDSSIINKVQIKDPTSNEININKVLFFIENSGSLKGYVNGNTDFKTSINALAHLPKFDGLMKNFYFINGRGNNCRTQYIGYEPDILESRLQNSYFNESYSDLTRMFEISLDSSTYQNIVILITDGLYDVGENDEPLKALARESEKTQEAFRIKLNNEDIQTIVLKLTSDFDGMYYYASQSGSITIQQPRPYYIFIFGKSQILQTLREEDFVKRLEKFEKSARFTKYDCSEVSYQILYENRLGRFRIDRQDNNRIIDAVRERHGNGFGFSVAVDFSTLPYPDWYFESTEIYDCNGSYFVTSIELVDREIYEVNDFKPTHIISLKTEGLPSCNLEVSVKNKLPPWVTNTNVNDETDINNQENCTYGFGKLLSAISKAYSHINNDKNMTKINIEINN